MSLPTIECPICGDELIQYMFVGYSCRKLYADTFYHSFDKKDHRPKIEIELPRNKITSAILGDNLQNLKGKGLGLAIGSSRFYITFPTLKVLEDCEIVQQAIERLRDSDIIK